MERRRLSWRYGVEPLEVIFRLTERDYIIGRFSIENIHKRPEERASTSGCLGCQHRDAKNCPSARQVRSEGIALTCRIFTGKWFPTRAHRRYNEETVVRNSGHKSQASSSAGKNETEIEFISAYISAQPDLYWNDHVQDLCV